MKTKSWFVAKSGWDSNLLPSWRRADALRVEIRAWVKGGTQITNPANAASKSSKFTWNVLIFAGRTLIPFWSVYLIYCWSMLDLYSNAKNSANSWPSPFPYLPWMRTELQRKCLYVNRFYTWPLNRLNQSEDLI